jgi:hypothetical protein
MVLVVVLVAVLVAVLVLAQVAMWTPPIPDLGPYLGTKILKPTLPQVSVCSQSVPSRQTGEY